MGFWKKARKVAKKARWVAGKTGKVVKGAAKVTPVILAAAKAVSK